MAELKPCPFCGSKKIIIEAFGFGDYSAKCSNCGAQTARHRTNIDINRWDIVSFDERAKEAIKAWNRRADNG